MSRIEEEYIIAIVRNRSGVDAGEIDYSLKVDKFEKMSIGCLKDTLKTMSVLETKIKDRLTELSKIKGE